MSVKHLFLAILSKKAMHGYDLKNAFEHLVSEQWTLNFGQVYTTLNRMERDGLVSSKEVRQVEKPDKKIYHLTEEGQHQLDQWLREEADWNVFGDALSFRLAALEYLDRSKATALLSEYRVYLLKLIGELVAQKAAIKDPNSLTAWIFERNIMKAEADLNWVDLYSQHKNSV
ncbi:MAG TPA: hypothetical protein DHD79_03420 [Firmicutes bacterium]|mgnify:CR=1 FL=1|jgi:DNA-binding PadR family transcriptional regulator|nr:hypothetical protein [Bacillota bacterium]HCX70272.1 hypothetical protein [Bacillota bacterium]